MLVRPLPGPDAYQRLHRDFRWTVPDRLNIGVVACDRWADGSGRLALVDESPAGQARRVDFDELKRLSDRLAVALRARGLNTGDRVAILLPQSLSTALAHLATYKSGAIAVPLFVLFGVEALEYRLNDSGAKVLITDRTGWAKLAPIRDRLPTLKIVLCVDADQRADGQASGGVEDFEAALALAVDSDVAAFTPCDTSADEPALIIYTSGTTGKPKGALHAHRVLPGHLPGVEMSHEFFPERATMIWTPADWAWIGGLLDVLLPAWYHGVPVLARRFDKFEASAAYELLARHQVSHAFLPPTALKMLRAQTPPTGTYRFGLRSVASGGESLGEELLDWGRQVLGVTINEFYGQTECNMVVSSCSSLFDPRPGVIGRAVPGHDVQIVDDQGMPLPVGQQGNIGIRAPDPVMFIGYWGNEKATREKFAGEFLLTGDIGVQDADGFIRFVGRNDDVITSAGYRIGPGPIEDCLIGHPAVRLAAVVGTPDAQRTEIVTAFIVLNEGVAPGEALIREIQNHVRTRLAAHEYPRAIHFVDELPMTTTGKVIRRALRDSLAQR